MPQTVDVPVADMLLDPANARLGEVQESQQATVLALAGQQGPKLVTLAASIQSRGLDPAQLPVVISTGDRRRRYLVLEGNRRVLALKALETPSLVQSALRPADFKRLSGIANKFADAPIDLVTCVLFDQDEEDEAYTWITMRHTSGQAGAGLEEWDSDEKDRFAARHGLGKSRGLSGQVIDFLKDLDGPSASKTRVATNIGRIVGGAYAREKLGLDKVGDDLVSYYPKDEVAKGLRRLVDDLRTGAIKVPEIYTREQQADYVNSFKRTQLPKKSTRLPAPVKLADLASGANTPVTTKPKRRRSRPKPPRTSIAPNNANLNPGPPRINQIFNELVDMPAESFPNAGSVLLRVFLELSVDDYLKKKNLMTESERRNTVLAKRMKSVADHLASNGVIDGQLKMAIHKVADSQHTLAASVQTFNQYVHNQYVFPKATELRTSWDELQPFLEAIWA